jgi:hypothetical protein
MSAPTLGPMKAASEAVVKRSYSRNCGDTDDEVVTKASGITSSTIALARCSWAGLRYENRKQMATDSTPSSFSSAAARRTASSSSGTSTLPRGGASRPGTVLR